MQETGYKIRDQESIHYVTFSVVYWIGLSSRQRYRDILLNNLCYYQQKKGLVVYGYVIMSDHMHLILKSEIGKLIDTIRDYKPYTSKKLIETIKEYPESRRGWMLWMIERAEKDKRNTIYQIWAHDNHPEELESNKFLDQKLNYIHDNPVRAGIVQNPEGYLYSSARDYADISGYLGITKIC